MLQMFNFDLILGPFRVFVYCKCSQANPSVVSCFFLQFRKPLFESDGNTFKADD